MRQFKDASVSKISMKSSVEYQIALKDVREQIKGLNLHARGAWWAQRLALAWYLVSLAILIAIIWPTCLLQYLRREDLE